MSSQVTTTVWVAYWYYAISEPDLIGVEVELAVQGTSNGLVAVASGYAMLWTGTQTGRIDLTIDLRHDAPPLDLDAWDEVVEAALVFTTGQARIIEWGGGPRRDLPNLAWAGRGTYRLRCHARGRDEASGFSTLPDSSVEGHLIAIWPAPPDEVVVYQTTDQFGARRAEARTTKQRGQP